MVLPEPLWSDDDTKVAKEVLHKPWDNNPTTLAVLRALATCQMRLRICGAGYCFEANILDALAQKSVCFLHPYSLEVEELHY